MFGSHKNEGINHPLPLLVGAILKMLVLLFAMAVLTWLGTSMFVSSRYMARVYEQEQTMNRAVTGFAFGVERIDDLAWFRDWALVYGAKPAQQMIRATEHARSPAGRPDPDDRTAEVIGQTGLSEWFTESFFPTQRSYLPLLVYRSLLVAGVLVPGLVLLAGAYLTGQAVRRERLAEGHMLKPHRWHLVKMTVIMLAGLAFAYPAIPIALPAYVVLPVLIGALYGTTRMMSANMVEL